jgi:hypothetical protein
MALGTVGFGLLAPFTVAAFCFAASVGASDRFIDWPYLWLLFRNISPYFYAVVGVALCVGTSILGAAWCASSPPPPLPLQAAPQLGRCKCSRGGSWRARCGARSSRGLARAAPTPLPPPPLQGYLHHWQQPRGRSRSGPAHHL